MAKNISPIRWWDFPAAALLLAALFTAAVRLEATHWTAHLSFVQTVVVFGCIAGLALGKSRFSPRLVAFFTFAYGIFIIPWQLGLTLEYVSTWSERMIILVNRLGIILYQLANRETVKDSLLFLVIMGLIFWFISVHAGYTLVRYGRTWKAVLPGGLVLFIIHTFDPLVARRAWYLAIYLFFALVLVARMTYLHHYARWQQTQTATPPHTGTDFIRASFVATIIIVVFAWTIPVLASSLPAAEKAWQPIRQAWYMTRNRFDNAFASLRSSVSVVSEYYGVSASLGLGIPLGDAQIFAVRTPANIPPGIRLYWRARTYDTYVNGQWLSTNNAIHTFDPAGSDLSFPDEYGRWAGSFEFISANHMSTMLVPPQPIWVSHPAQVEYAENPDSTVDVSTFRAKPVIKPGQVYKVQSSVNYASITQLQEAGTEYPEWITERYLQLPDTITPRTHQLAQTIADGLETPYDKVLAVTQYLRDNITYVDLIPDIPPTEQETIDWFLFDYQKGFCNYYSTAEIILLRSLGIPSRWAIGYAQGDRLDDYDQGAAFLNANYIVRQRHAHAWPEVYFPGIGWVEFEPTGSQPVIARRTSATNESSNSILPPDDELDEQSRRELEEEMAMLRAERDRLNQASAQQRRATMVYWLVPLILGGGLLILFWRFRARINVNWRLAPVMVEAAMTKVGIQPPKTIQLWARRAALPPISRAYLEINSALGRLDERPTASETPRERAASLSQLLPPTKKPVYQLVKEYQLATFSKQPASLAVALRAGNDIKTLSLKAYLQRVASRLRRVPWRRRSTEQ